MNGNVDDNDSLEEGEIPSPSPSSPSPRQVSKRACDKPQLETSALAKKRKRGKRAGRIRSRKSKCHHCGRTDPRDVVDDFDQMRNKYFLRLRKEKESRISRDFLSRLPRLSSIAGDKHHENNASPISSVDMSDEDADIDKLRDQALESQRLQSTPRESDEENEFSLRAEALKTALVKKSRMILSKKKAKVDQPCAASVSHEEPMECTAEGKENESLDENVLRQQLLENLVRRRETQPKVVPRLPANLPFSPNRNSLNKPSTSKMNEHSVKPAVPAKVLKPSPNVKRNRLPVKVPVKTNTMRLINNHNKTKSITEEEPGRIVVRLGPDSSDDESEPDAKQLPVKTDQNVESKITEFLLNARRRTETNKPTPGALSDHLPLPQRIEYCRLKKELAEKELKLKSNKLGASLKPEPKPGEKQTLAVANKLFAILKKEEAHEQRFREELTRLRMQIGFVEQKMLTHAKNAVRVKTRLKSLLLSSKKLVKPKSNQSVAVKDDITPSKPIADVPTGSKDFSSYESPLNHTESVTIDPLLELCPHDLAGECRDPHCKYQHTRMQPGLSGDVPSVG